MPTKKEMLDKYVSRLAGEGKGKREYVRWAQEWAEYSNGGGDPLSREAVEAFLEHEAKLHHYGAGSRNTVFRVIRTIYNRSKVDWPFNRGESPTIDEEDMNVPAIDPDLVKEMITAVKASDNVLARTCLVLSSIYGLRRGELVGLDSEAVDLPNRIIHIRTLKHGRARSHMIPEAVVPYLEEYDFTQKRSEFIIWHLWYEIEYMISFEHVDGMGWHSLRRTVNTELQRVFGRDSAVVQGFMRWKQRTSSNMGFRYTATRYIGRGGTAKKLEGSMMDADRQIFAQKPDGTYFHPFLGSWEGD